MKNSLVDSIQAAASRSPHAIAVDVPGQKAVTYGDLLARVDAATAGYRAVGLAETDRVALIAPATVETVVAVLALSRLATVVPLNPAYTSSEVRAYLQAAGASALVVSDEKEELREVSRELSVPIVRATTAAGARVPALPRDETRRPAALLFQTSGTTARPKNVPLSHGNVIAGAANVVRALGLTAADSCLVMMPLHHVHGLIGCLLSTLTSGGRLILPASPSAVEAFDLLTTAMPTWYSGSPAVHHAMVARARAAGGQPRHALRLIRSASSPLPSLLIQDLRDAFGAPVVNAYGMTEGSHQIASTPLDECEQEGDVGFAVGCEVTARREDGTRADQDEIAEIWIRGDNVTAGYEPADGSVDADGWLRTGDVGTVDARGRVCLKARKKELINKGGEKISPAEIDAVLLTLPGVAEAAAFGIPDSRLGEDVAAAIVARAGTTLSPEEVRESLARQIASFKVPRKIFFVDQLPRGATGKVLRRRLAESLPEPTHEDTPARGTPIPATVVDGLVEVWKDVLRIDHVGLEQDFFELGGDSLAAAELVLRVSERFGNEPSLTSFFAAPTVAAMASSIHIGEVAPGGAARALVALRADGTETPLFVVHGPNLSVDHYRPLVRHLPVDIPVFGVQEDLFRDPPYVASDLPELASHYVEAIRTRQPHGPYRLGGFSSAGLIAAEMARTLRARGEEVERLILMDTYPLWLWGTRTWLAFRIRNLGLLAPLRQAALVAAMLRARLRRARQMTAVSRGDLGRSIAERIARLRANTDHLLRTHRPGSLDVPVTLIVTAEAQALWAHPHLHWDLVTPDIEAIVISGTHCFILDEPQVDQVASALAPLLMRGRLV